MKKFLAWSKTLYIAVGVLCLLSLPFVGLGMYKLHDLSNTNVLVVCAVVWILLFMLTLIVLIFSYKEQLKKQSDQNGDVEYLKSLNKQMFSDILNYETTIQELKAKLEEKE